MQGAAAEGMSRASPSAMDKADESAKKARLEPPNGHVKQELGVHEAAAGGGAIVAAGEHSPRVGLAVRIDKRVLHCPLCTLPFKPPVLQCKGGHFACGVCVAQLPRCQCKACVDGGGLFGPCPALDAVVSLTRIEYPNAGCQRYVTYHEAGEHQSACAHAPCRCTEPGCELVDAAPLLAGHLEAVHFVQVRTVHYGRVSRVQVPVSAPRLLLLVEEDDGRVFIHPDRGRARRVHVRRVRVVRPAAVHVQDVGKPCGVERRQDGRRPGGDADEEQHLGGRRGRRQRADVPLGAGGVPGPRSGRGWHGGGP